MLEVLLENESLELEADAAVSITATNPILDKDSIPRKFSLPFTLPVSPKNARIFAHRHRLDAVRATAKRSGKIRFMGDDVAIGNVIEQKSSPDRLEVAYANEVLDIWKKLGEFKISEILETVAIATPGLPLARWQFQLDVNPATYTMTFPAPLGTVTQTAGSGPVDRDIAGGTLAASINAVVPGFASYFSGGELYLDGALMNQWPVSYFAGMSIVSAVSPGWRKYLNVKGHVEAVNATPVDTHCFPVVLWPSFYPLFTNAPFQQAGSLVNAAADGAWFEIVPTAVTADAAWENTVVPMVRVPYVLERIRARLGYDIWRGDVWDDAEFQELILLNNYALDSVSKDYYDDLTFKNLNVFKQEIDLNRHVPALSAADFVRALCATFNLLFEADGGALSFQKKTAIIALPPENISAFTAPNYAIERSEQPGWALKYAKDAAEMHIVPAGHLTEISSGSGGSVTEVARTLDWVTGVILGDNGLAKLPVTSRSGVSDYFDQKTAATTMPLTLLFYRGLQNTSLSDPYPYASHDTTNYAGGSVGAYSLDISGTSGLYAKWHKGHVELADADAISVTARLPLHILQQLLLWENARIRIIRPAGSVVCVVKSLSFSLRKRGLSEVKLTALRQ